MNNNIYKKAIFVHVPKTGGVSTFKSGLSNNKNFSVIDHNSRSENYKYLKDRFMSKDNFFFATKRDPWRRFESAFFFLKNGGVNGFDKRDADTFLKDFKTPEELLQNWDDEVLNLVHFQPQLNWIADGKNILVDLVEDISNLQKTIDLICEMFNFKKVKVEHRNTSKKNRPSYKITKKSLDKFGELYWDDIETLGYTKNFQELQNNV